MEITDVHLDIKRVENPGSMTGESGKKLVASICGMQNSWKTTFIEGLLPILTQNR